VADEQTSTETSTETSQTADVAAPNLATETTALGNDPAPDAEAAPAADATADDGAEKPDGDKDETAEKVIPEAYELTPPEGMTLDADTLALATPVFKELGLSNEQAQSLIPVASEFAKKITDSQNAQILASVSAQRKEWFDTSKADPEIGGANWDKTISTAAMALDKLGATKGTPFRTLLDDSGLGNHPEMIRMMKRVGDAIGEDSSFVRSDSSPAKKLPREQIMYPDDVPKS